MDSNSNKEELISRRNLYILRKEKVQKEIETARRLIKNKVNILEIADNFIHSVFEIMKDGISSRNVDLSEEEIYQKVRNNLALNQKLKSMRKRNKNFG
jgi:hypothetical protein